ncbi:hypothetical protein ACHAW6_002048, partial [Cyclotella cf. meneghiniana]
MRARTTKELIAAYQALYARWKVTGVICPNWHVLDNDAPEDLKQAIPERAIQTFKGHLISVLAGVSDDFPINQWDELLPQTVLTLNLLRQSNIAPNISAYAYHHGSFDYNQKCHLHPWGALCNSISNQADARHGANIQATD